MPDFRGRDRYFSSFRTKIRDGIKSGANLAGHYTIIGWGCGTECVDYVVADVATGKVFKFPLSGEVYGELQLDAKINSRLIVAKWVERTGDYTSDDLPLERCSRQSFLWSHDSAIPLGKPATIAIVRSDKDGSCFGR